MKSVIFFVVLFQILGYADHVFTGLFTIEIILKVVYYVMGHIMSGTLVPAEKLKLRV